MLKVIERPGIDGGQGIFCEKAWWDEQFRFLFCLRKIMQ